MRNQGIGSWTARRAGKTPDRLAVVHVDREGAGREWTYRQLHERVLRLAHGLRGLGVGPGDRVAYLGPNHPAILETLFAAGMIGAVFVPLNMRLAGPELAYNLSDSGTDVLVYAPEQAGVVDAIRVDVPVREFVALDADYERLIASSPDDAIDTPVGLDDDCMIMYTSGTTGRPKGAVLTHGNITWNSVNVLVDIDLASDEVTLVVAPLFHTAGLNMTCLPTLLKGGTVVIVPAFDPAVVLDLVETRRVTYMFGVPAMYNAIAACPAFADTDLSSLRQVNCGGAPVPEATIQTYLQRGLAFSQGYGMTEASPGALYLARDMSTAKAGTAGKPHFFTDVRVVRPGRTEAGQVGPDLTEVRPGEKGEIVVSGPNVMRGYWGRPEATAEVLDADGWFHSGDVGSPDADGYIAIVDRIKDMIISGGENIYPAEVEGSLYDHPAVAECAVIGVADDRWGEVGRAVVVLKAGTTVSEEELLDFLRGRLARYKIPKSVVFVDALPRNAAGKLLKGTVRGSYGN
ncbi:acyl-CoA synthetase [Planosporangium mesophilum]|uniref:Fatty-acyl-CoA synthase n=1 Tax=Planosporangium mesophilum TaxID=689768 RepID=A0A8J3TH38_9ACTN|nr:long-chain fatty acid--CoA ligase [Planosporangium mesophilum]NJC86722.1 long-chain fatty acid--CoA ligase [Planosporangium mesophilum]GII25652.1 fatty-acyl-CoA synthase [Planosporangium mesophilum]